MILQQFKPARLNRGGGEIPMLSAKTPANVVKLKIRKEFSYEYRRINKI